MAEDSGQSVSTDTASLYFGGITCITGIGGTLLGGYLSQVRLIPHAVLTGM